jgi:hypothetical protein
MEDGGIKMKNEKYFGHTITFNYWAGNSNRKVVLAYSAYYDLQVQGRTKEDAFYKMKREINSLEKHGWLY